MFIVGSWNIWGLNGLHKQKTVHAWTQKHILDIFGLLETKITAVNLAAIQTNLAPSHWKYHSNIASSPTCRILVGWNTQKLHLNCLHTASQWLTCEATTYSSPHPIRITFIYGHNTPAERNTLWNYIAQESAINSHIPWLVMGDFNAILSAEDRTGGDNAWPRHQDEFATCMSQAQLLQAPTTGLKFTWHNGQQGCNTIQKTLDWVFGNPSLFSAWPATHATVQPRHISDHSAIILNLNNLTHHYHSPFKFLNLWADRSDFLDTVTSSWQVPVNGNPMYRFTTKLRRLKTALKHLHSQYTSSITDRVAKAKADWDTEQVHLDMHPTSEIAKETERSLASQYMQLCKAEESFYKQKSRVQWLQLGDRNTTFFHKSLLHRQVRNRVHNLQDAEGNLVHDQQKIGKIASAYYEELLSTPQPLLTEDITNLFPNSITEESKAAALMPITDEDIRAALFSIPYTKAPGPDGYNALFYKKSWDIIKADFTAAIRFFFSTNLLPRCVNATRVALVPKTEQPACMSDFRPISCCNVLYKCISKLIVIRLKAALVDVIGPSQSVFLPGRNISDAILITQELLHNYHHKTGSARCALKVD
ncbi:hypothetical protein NC652_030338 [Populus alba x Populus x berolinensis]|nr:hypothetical protein NC652_030338 [Populus alba x Populus x berolinensis]